MTNKEAILQILDRIEHLTKRPENKWLLEELQHRWGTCNNEAKNTPYESVEKIEKYLAIDYRIDDIELQIDYSFVKDKILRMKLESDWREMLRYRCGVRKHEPDFLEFCRFANLQAEGIVNYYCYTVHPSEEQLKVACNSKSEYATYWDKLELMSNKSIISNSLRFFLYNYIYQVRNIQSHRGISNQSLELDKTQKRVRELIVYYNLPTTIGDDSIVDTHTVNINKMRYKGNFDLFLNSLKEEGIDYYNYTLRKWCRTIPYLEVENNLAALANSVKRIIS